MEDIGDAEGTSEAGGKGEIKSLKIIQLGRLNVVVVFVTMISIVYRYRSILAFPLEFIGHILNT